MCESEVKAAMPKIVNGTAARTSFQNSQSYTFVIFLFEWRILCEYGFFKDTAKTTDRDNCGTINTVLILLKQRDIAIVVQMMVT